MIHLNRLAVVGTVLTLLLSVQDLWAQQPPYDVYPAAQPPYYRVRYEASVESGELKFPVNYTVWIPPGVERVRGVVVHQHGCGEGSCKSGLTGAYDLHWQALARKHFCALLAPAYEQPETADCQMWCDPRNGSAATFLRCLRELGAKSGHPELDRVPWALWGHSGGGHWAGGMVLLYPERVAAAWLRSGVPLLEAEVDRPGIKTHRLTDESLGVPIMLNLGTKEGVTVKDGNFAKVWPSNEKFFRAVRSRNGKIAVAIDPLTGHECGNQRYLAIPWLDVCLNQRLPVDGGEGLRQMSNDGCWLAAPTSQTTYPQSRFDGDPLTAGWLPNDSIARAWMEYVADSRVIDRTPPPPPTNVRVKGAELLWDADADLESGLAGFEIRRDGQELAKVPEQSLNPFGRPVFQNLQYSDTPPQPLSECRFVDETAVSGMTHVYEVIAVNTAGLKSAPSVTTVPVVP